MEEAIAANWNDQGVKQSVDDASEIYMVKDAVWKAAGMGNDNELWAAEKRWGGCLCIGCLEKRIGRLLTPQDFSDHVFNSMPGTERLLSRREMPLNRQQRRALAAMERKGQTTVTAA
jgi:hypothetical protein